jgi:hypothetical protein
VDRLGLVEVAALQALDGGVETAAGDPAHAERDALIRP